MDINRTPRKAIALEPLNIKNIAYLNTKLTLIREKYENAPRKTKRLKLKSDWLGGLSLHKSLDKIKRKVEELKKANIPETERQATLPAVYNTNEKLLEAFIQRRLVYDMENYFNNELNYETKMIHENEKKNKNKRNEFSHFLKEKFDVKNLVNRLQILKDGEVFKNKDCISDEFFSLTLRFIKFRNDNVDYEKKISLNFLQANYLKFIKSKMEEEFTIDTITEYITKSYKNVFIYRGLPVYGVIYILLRTGKIEMLKEFLLNNEILKEFKEIFPEENLFKNLMNFLNENNQKYLKPKPLKTKDTFYETLIEILSPQKGNNKLPVLIACFEDYLFYRLINGQETTLRKELESLKKKSSRNTSLYLFGKTLLNEEGGFKCLLETKDLFKIYLFLYATYFFNKQENSKEDYSKYFIDLTLKLLENKDLKQIEINNLLNMLFPVKEEYKNYLVTKLFLSAVDFSFILEKDISLKNFLITKLENSNKRSIILRNKNLISDYEKYLHVLLEDFILYLIGDMNIKYEFIKQIKEQTLLVSKYKDMFIILNQIYSYFTDPTIENLKRTLISNPVFHNVNNVNNINRLIEKLVLKSCSLIKKNREYILARNTIELLELYDLQLNKIGTEFIMLF